MLREDFKAARYGEIDWQYSTTRLNWFHYLLSMPCWCTVLIWHYFVLNVSLPARFDHWAGNTVHYIIVLRWLGLRCEGVERRLMDVPTFLLDSWSGRAATQHQQQQQLDLAQWVQQHLWWMDALVLGQLIGGNFGHWKQSWQNFSCLGTVLLVGEAFNVIFVHILG